jgi:hypothetical protein
MGVSALPARSVRKLCSSEQPEIWADLIKLLEGNVIGDPESPPIIPTRAGNTGELGSRVW